MRRVRGKDTGPELRVRKALHRAGYRFRLQRRDLPGRPDLYLPRYRVAVFVHGCFWHGHESCKRARLPDTRRDFWAAKIGRNKERDRETLETMKAMGITVVTLWQCELREDAAIVRRVDEATERVRPL